MVTYYKNNQLDVRRTALSILRYNLSEYLHFRKPSKVLVEDSYEEAPLLIQVNA